MIRMALWNQNLKSLTKDFVMQVKLLHLFVNSVATCMFILFLLAAVTTINCNKTIYIIEEKHIDVPIKLSNSTSEYEYVALNNKKIL